jgi:hypothetical protein
MRSAALIVMCAGLTFQPTGRQPPTTQAPALAAAVVTTGAAAHAIVSLEVRESRLRDVYVAAVRLTVDGRDDQHVILTPGVDRTHYSALIGPLPAGRHELELHASPHWPWPAGLAVANVTTRIVPADDPLTPVLAYAPVLGVRADTIGTASDLPLLMYVEDDRAGGSGWLRYSVIFSNEDGGTPPRALMARWGRTTDIELAYETEWQAGRLVQDRIQGPDHRVLPFNGPRVGQHPFLLVATLNNMFIDRGASVASVRPIPVPVTLANATRESVMDGHPWMYRVMGRELEAEGRIGSQVEDPREFLYVEARLDLENGAVAALAESNGAWLDSSRGEEDLAVARSGWVRIAIPGAALAGALKWRCQARPGNGGAAPSCRVDTRRAFRLERNYTPGPNLVEPEIATLSLGTGSAIPLRRQ